MRNRMDVVFIEDDREVLKRTELKGPKLPSSA